MICLIANSYREALTWARGQNLHTSEWFFPQSEMDLYKRENFHVIVVGVANENVPISYFNRVYDLAIQRGKLNRR